MAQIGSATELFSPYLVYQVPQSQDALCVRFRQFEPEKPIFERLQGFYAVENLGFSEAERVQFNELVIGLLRQELFFEKRIGDIWSVIDGFRAVGLPLRDIGSIFDPLLDQLGGNWANEVESLVRSFATNTTAQDLIDSVDWAFERLQGKVDEESKPWHGCHSGAPTAVEQKLLHIQCQTLITFFCHAIRANVAFLTQNVIEAREKEMLLKWVSGLEKDFSSYASSPSLPTNDALNEMAQEIKKIKKSLDVVEVKKDIPSLASRIARCVGYIFMWLPTLIIHIGPVVIAAIAGYRARGLRGAAVSAGVAGSMSALSLCSGIIAKKVSSEATRLGYFPAPLNPSALGILTYAIRMQVILFSMQVNGLIAGMITKGFESEGGSQGFFQNVAATGVAAVDLPVQLGKFAVKEFSLAKSILGTGLSQEMFGKISEVYNAQLEASVASYHLGEAAAQLPKSCFQVIRNCR